MLLSLRFYGGGVDPATRVQGQCPQSFQATAEVRSLGQLPAQDCAPHQRSRLGLGR